MESRKIYISGGSTYVVSLPKKWVERENLRAGDSVAVTLQEGSLIIEPRPREKEPAVREIKTSELRSPDELQHLLISLYLVGYDTIRLRLDNKDPGYREVVRQTLDFLIGAEVMEDTGDSLTVEILLDHSRMQTAQALQRIHLICKSMLVDVIAVLKKMNVQLAGDVITREKEVDRLYFLVVRQLKSAVRYHEISERLGMKNQRDALGYRITVKSFERIADHIENIARSCIEAKDGLGSYVEFAQRVLEAYETAVKSFFGRDEKLAEEVFVQMKKIRQQRDEISNKLFKQRIPVSSALLQKTILDSLGRIANYSSDIAEIAINMSVDVP